MNYLKAKWNSFSRYMLWHHFSKTLDLVHIAEYPKSGGSWMTQLVSNTTGIPTRRNQLPKFEKSIMHGHYLYSKKFNKTVCVVRDGRDVLTSYYHHMILGNVNSLKDNLKRARIEKRRELLGLDDINDIKTNLPRFIEYIHNDYSKKLNGFTWSEFMETFLDQENVLIVRYEDMLLDTSKELTKVLNYIEHNADAQKIQEVVEKFSFKNQTNRKPGQENKKSFLRKGIAGDWKNHFNEESKMLFDTYYGDMLIKLGYENDRSWANTNEAQKVAK